MRRFGPEEIAALNLEARHWDPAKAVLLGVDGKPLPPGAPLPTVKVLSRREALELEARPGVARRARQAAAHPPKPPVRFGPRR